jgi:hypothetical protein
MSITDDLPHAAAGRLTGEGTSARAVPDFVCIGAQKAGTTWLYRMLSQNQSLFLPPIKEIHFFDYIYIDSHRQWVANAFKRRAKALARTAEFRQYASELKALDRNTDAWYAAIFAHPKAHGRVTGEITPAYSMMPAPGIERARAVNPGLKVLFIIRDPIDRALSHLRMVAERRKWAGIGADVLERSGLMANVTRRSAYRRNIARWEAVFPREQILYLPYRRIRPEPEAVLREVETFIGAEPWAYADLSGDVHKSAPTTIDPAVTAALEARLGGERAWLRSRFGADFMA